MLEIFFRLPIYIYKKEDVGQHLFAYPVIVALVNLYYKDKQPVSPRLRNYAKQNPSTSLPARCTGKSIAKIDSIWDNTPTWTSSLRYLLVVFVNLPDFRQQKIDVRKRPFDVLAALSCTRRSRETISMSKPIRPCGATGFACKFNQ